MAREGWKQPLGIEVEAEIMARWLRLQKRIRQKDIKKMAAYDLIAKALDLELRTVAGVIYRHRPTTEIARLKLRAAASELVDRVVAKANVQEAIDLLSRKELGVLTPMKTGGGGPGSGGGGLFLSVQADSCGAVKVGMFAGPTLQGLPAADDAIDTDGYTVEEEDEDEDWYPGREDGRSKELLIESARRKLEAARATATGRGTTGRPDHAGQEIGGVQAADGESEEAE